MKIIKRLVGIAAVSALALTSGCIESTTLLDVKRDGSGKIVVREYFSPQITQMMEGMGNMFQNMEQSETDAAKPEKPDTNIFEDMIQGNVEEFGEGVTLVKSEKASNDMGWKGYQAVYEFDDINNVSVTLGDSESPGAGGGQAGPVPPSANSQSSDSPQYTFSFTGGDTCELEIIPKAPEISEESPETQVPEEAEAEMAEASEAMEGMEGQMMEGMGAMMGQMMKGMRMRFLVRVEGEIEDTNSSYPVEGHPGMITVMDMPVDKMLGNSEAMSILQSQDPESLKKLQEMDMEEIKLEPPSKRINILF